MLLDLSSVINPYVSWHFFDIHHISKSKSRSFICINSFVDALCLHVQGLSGFSGFFKDIFDRVHWSLSSRSMKIPLESWAFVQLPRSWDDFHDFTLTSVPRGCLRLAGMDNLSPFPLFSLKSFSHFYMLILSICVLAAAIEYAIVLRNTEKSNFTFKNSNSMVSFFF